MLSKQQLKSNQPKSTGGLSCMCPSEAMVHLPIQNGVYISVEVSFYIAVTLTKLFKYRIYLLQNGTSF